MICADCNNSILPGEERADIVNADIHRECALRTVMGGIGHLLDHAHFCHGPLGPDAGLDRRTSALMVDVWVHRNGVEAAVAIPTETDRDVPPRHDATSVAWEWLESQTLEELPRERRERISLALMQVDRIFLDWETES